MYDYGFVVFFLECEITGKESEKIDVYNYNVLVSHAFIRSLLSREV